MCELCQKVTIKRCFMYTTGTVLKHPEKYHVHHAIKIGDYNVGRDGALLTIPFYMAFLLTELNK